MVCEYQPVFISHEVDDFLATRPFHRDGLRQLGAMLPADDDELHDALAGVAASSETSSFSYGFAAALITRRRLRASLLPCALAARCSEWHIAWAAWRMEGDVTSELLRGLEETIVPNDDLAVCLFVAAAWWLEHRQGEEPPRQIARLRLELSKNTKLSARALAVLGALGRLLGPDRAAMPLAGAGLHATLLRKQQGKESARIFELLNGPFDGFVLERRTHDFVSSVPQRRAVAHIGRNEKCPCASGKKYKQCCYQNDRERLRLSSPVAGLTQSEFEAAPSAVLTEAMLQKLRPAQLLDIRVQKLQPDLQPKYLVLLGAFRHYDWAIASLHTLSTRQGEGRTLPAHLHEAWSALFEFAIQHWNPEFARDLFKVFSDAEEKLGQKTHAGLRLLLVGDDQSQFLQTLESELHIALREPDSEELQRLVWAVLASPYRALGIFLVRSLLPIVEDKFVPTLFEAILEVRAKLNLSPDDEFSDFMDRRALRAARDHDSAAVQEATDKLVASNEQVRRAKEEKAQLERELRLFKQQERRAAERTGSSVSSDRPSQETMREHKRKIEQLSATMAENAQERLQLRRETEKLTRENEALRTAQQKPTPAEEDDEAQTEAASFSAAQPVRTLAFSDDFTQTLRIFAPHVGRAVMSRLGRLASGEAGVFQDVKQLKAYPAVLRMRLCNNHRLLFTVTPDRIRVIDLILRRDLDRRIEKLLASGLPNN